MFQSLKSSLRRNPRIKVPYKQKKCRAGEKKKQLWKESQAVVRELISSYQSEDTIVVCVHINLYIHIHNLVLVT